MLTVLYHNSNCFGDNTSSLITKYLLTEQKLKHIKRNICTSADAESRSKWLIQKSTRCAAVPLFTHPCTETRGACRCPRMNRLQSSVYDFPGHCVDPKQLKLFKAKNFKEHVELVNDNA